MTNANWRGAMMLLTLVLTACGGGSEDSNPSSTTDDPSATTKVWVGNMPIVMVPAAPEALPDPSAPKLSVVGGQFVIKTSSGAASVLEDPDGDGPMPKRNVGTIAASSTLALAQDTTLSQVLQARYYLQQCRLVASTTYVDRKWVKVPVVTFQRQCDDTEVRLDGMAIATAFASPPNAIAVSEGRARTAFASSNGDCKQIHVIDARGDHDVVTHIDLASTGNCAPPELSLAIAGDTGVLAVGMAKALNAQGLIDGAVQMFNFADGQWHPGLRITAPTETRPWSAAFLANTEFGFSVALSANGQRLMVGAPNTTFWLAEVYYYREVWGATFLFETPPGGWHWQLASTQTSYLANNGRRLGHRVQAVPGRDAWIVADRPQSSSADCAQLPQVRERSRCLWEKESWRIIVWLDGNTWLTTSIADVFNSAPGFSGDDLADISPTPWFY